MVLAVVLILLVIGSIIFHFASPWWFTEIASNWQTIDDTVLITFCVTGIVFVAVNLFMANAIARAGQAVHSKRGAGRFARWRKRDRLSRGPYPL